jgi:hypothetical protein
LDTLNADTLNADTLSASQAPRDTLNAESLTLLCDREDFARVVVKDTGWTPQKVAALLKAREVSDDKLAIAYAPILRFAPGEHYYPTLPFFTAFDKLPRWYRPDSLGPTYSSVVPVETFRIRYQSRKQLGGIRDPWSYRSTDSIVRRVVPSYAQLAQRYLAMTEPGQTPSEARVPVRAVLYRVCDIPPSVRAERARREPAPSSQGSERLHRDDAAAVWRYLKSDEQAWHRFGLDTLTSKGEPGSGPGSCPTRIPATVGFRVIQYFFYYVADRGLEGHPNDLESVFVFIPKVPGFGTVGSCFRIIVGAGHDDPAPNNVLVMFPPEAQRDKFLAPNILVEFGGHSSAPDMPPYGQFSAGLDVNWHIDDIWGTRDMQASGGVSYHGRYQGTMTYPRDPEGAVTLIPNGLNKASRDLLTSLVRISAGSLAEEAEKAADAFAIDSARQARLRRAQPAITPPFDTAAVQRLAPLVEEQYRSVGLAWQGIQYEQSPAQAAEKPATTGGDSFFVSLRTAFQSPVTTSYLDALRSGRIKALLDTLREPRRLSDSAGVVARLITSKSRAAGAAPARVADTIRAVLRQYVPIDSAGAPGSARSRAIVERFRKIEGDKLLPRYTLVPISYLRRLYDGAWVFRELSRFNMEEARETVDSMADSLGRYVLLIGGAVNKANCTDPLFCGLADTSRSLSDSINAIMSCSSQVVPSLLCQINEAGGRVDSSTALEIASWDDEDSLWRARDGFGQRISTTVKYKPWEHNLYRRPANIFRTHLFRPTMLQSSASGEELTRLLTFGMSVYPGAAIGVNYGFIIPTIPSLPFRIPGYVQIELGPYLSWFDVDPTKVGFSASVLYDSRYVYLWGWFLRATATTNRAAVERDADAHWLTVAAGPTFWFPFAKNVHLRTGLRFDLRGGTPRFSTAGWSFELDLHQ